MEQRYVLEMVQRGNNTPIAWSRNKPWLDYVAEQKTRRFDGSFQVRPMRDGETNIPRVGATVKIVPNQN
jgi:hypothetical protein